MSAFDQEALDRASWELQRHFGREGSIYGIKACEEIARIALTAYGVPEVLRSEPLAWAIFAAGTHEMIDVVLIEPEDPIGMYAEPLFARSPQLYIHNVAPQGPAQPVKDDCTAFGPPAAPAGAAPAIDLTVASGPKSCLRCGINSSEYKETGCCQVMCPFAFLREPQGGEGA